MRQGMSRPFRHRPPFRWSTGLPLQLWRRVRRELLGEALLTAAFAANRRSTLTIGYGRGGHTWAAGWRRREGHRRRLRFGGAATDAKRRATCPQHPHDRTGRRVRPHGSAQRFLPDRDVRVQSGSSRPSGALGGRETPRQGLGEPPGDHQRDCRAIPLQARSKPLPRNGKIVEIQRGGLRAPHGRPLRADGPIGVAISRARQTPRSSTRRPAAVSRAGSGRFRIPVRSAHGTTRQPYRPLARDADARPPLRDWVGSDQSTIPSDGTPTRRIPSVPSRASGSRNGPLLHRAPGRDPRHRRVRRPRRPPELVGDWFTHGWTRSPSRSSSRTT